MTEQLSGEREERRNEGGETERREGEKEGEKEEKIRLKEIKIETLKDLDRKNMIQ